MSAAVAAKVVDKDPTTQSRRALTRTYNALGNSTLAADPSAAKRHYLKALEIGDAVELNQSSNKLNSTKAAGVDASASRDIRQDMWNKFVFLAAFAGITCLMRASIGTVLTTDHGRERILLLIDETGSVAQAEGFAPPATLMDEHRTLLTREGSPLTSSMLRDIEAGRRTEGVHILGDMMARARRHGIATPLLATASAHVEAYERRLDAKS